MSPTACYMRHVFSCPWVYYSKSIWWEDKLWNTWLCGFPPASSNLLHLRSKYFPRYCVIEYSYPSDRTFLSFSDPARQFYRIGSLHPPRHPLTTIVFRTSIRETSSMSINKSNKLEPSCKTNRRTIILYILTFAIVDGRGNWMLCLVRFRTLILKIWRHRFVQMLCKWIQPVKYTTYIVHLTDCIHFYIWDCHSLEVEVSRIVRLINLCGQNGEFYTFWGRLYICMGSFVYVGVYIHLCTHIHVHVCIKQFSYIYVHIHKYVLTSILI